MEVGGEEDMVKRERKKERKKQQVECGANILSEMSFSILLRKKINKS